MPKNIDNNRPPTISSLAPSQRRLLLQEWMGSRFTTVWGEIFSVDKRAAEAADYFARQVERFEEWLASRDD